MYVILFYIDSLLASHASSQYETPPRHGHLDIMGPVASGYVKIAIEAMAQSKYLIYPARKWWMFP